MRLAPLAAALLLGACSGAEEAAIESAHAVFMAQPGCDYVIAKTTGRGYAVLRPTGPYEPRHGDLLVGNLREGTLTLGLVPATTDDLTPGLTFEVAGYDLALSDAQRRYYALCPPSSDGAF